MKNQSVLRLLLLTLICTTAFASSAFALTAEDFSDVPLTHKNYDAIMSLRDNGIVDGYADNTFKPENNINRVEALKLVYEVSGLQSVMGIAPATFSDIEDMAWYTPYLNLAVFKEIVQGYPDGTFKPEQNVNRVEFLKMLLLAQQVDLSKVHLAQIPYADVMPGQWYTKYIDFAKIHNLITADENNMVFPAEFITRGEAAEIIYRFKNIDWTVTTTPTDSTTVTNDQPVSAEDTNFALYVSDAYKFAVKYPKLWFYAGGVSDIAGAIREYQFGPDDLETSAPRVTLTLLPLATEVDESSTSESGVKYNQVSENGTTKITRKIADNRVYQFSGADADVDVMLYMMASITTDTTGLTTFNPAEKTAVPATEVPATTETPTVVTPATDPLTGDQLPPSA